MAQRAIDLPAIEAEIERIRSLGLDALRARWRSMFGAMPPMALTKDLIARMMIYRIQEEAFGGLVRGGADRVARQDAGALLGLRELRKSHQLQQNGERIVQDMNQN
jgi:Protein of unknown function (DUF2924)